MDGTISIVSLYFGCRVILLNCHVGVSVISEEVTVVGIAFVLLLLSLCMAFGVLCQKLLAKPNESGPVQLHTVNQTPGGDDFDGDFDESGA